MRGQIVVSFLVGLFFAAGLCLSGMAQPQNILAFLDFAHWKPQLLFVMVGAVLVYSVGYRIAINRSKPILAQQFEISSRRDVTVELIAGSALFGVGWGLAGYCGGPAIISLVAGKPQAVVFVIAMFVGMYLHGVVLNLRAGGDVSRNLVKPTGAN